MLAPTSGSASATSAQGLPWPEGDAGALRSAARQLHAAADGMRAIGSGVASAGAGAATGWHGDAAAAFHATVGTERANVDAGAGALEHAVGALHRLAAAVEAAQDAVRALDEQVREAEEAADRAEAAAAAAAAASAAASTLVDLAGAIGHAPHALVDAAGDAADAAARAGGSASSARAHAQDVRTRAMSEAAGHVDDVRAADSACAGAVEAAAGAAPMGGAYPAPGATPAQAFTAETYRDVNADEWRQISYFLAGIDHWDPSEGLVANDANVQAVYKLYGELWSHDHNLQWAGMANLVGPLFYGGWQDMETLRTLSDGGDRERYILETLGLPHLPGILYKPADLAQDLIPGGAISSLGSGELDWYEKRFLDMQKQIFDDMAWKHVAYSMGGIEMMRTLRSNGQIESTEMGNWEHIASGDPGRVDQGNLGLLRREQLRIIQNDYTDMDNHDGPVGDTFTEVLTFTANNPIPGGHSYMHDYHHNVEIPLTPDVKVPFTPWHLPQAHVTTPIQVPTGNVSNFEDRWNWISHDMVPNYQHLLHDPGQMQAIVDTPVAQRADDWRMVPLPYNP
jgi:uncharacterized protein YukE